MSLPMENSGGSATCSDSSIMNCEFSQNLDILRQIDLFSGMPLEGLKVFALVSTREKYKTGDHLFVQGNDDGHAYYIFSGNVELTYKENGEEIVIREIGAGELVGVMSIMGDVPRLYSLRASTDVECFVMAREKFRSTVSQFPELMPKIIKVLVDKIYTREKLFLTSRNPECEACRRNMGSIFA